MAAAAFSYRSKHNSSDSESENSDQECQDWKRASRRTEAIPEKIPIDVPPTEPPANPNPELKPGMTKRKRNNIWCEVMEDQLLSESLNHIGVKQLPKGYGSRGEESYDYTLGRKFHRKQEDSDGAMSDDAMSDSTEASSLVSFKSKRFNSSRHVELDNAGRDAARKIIKVLAEQKHYLIYRVVKFLGIEKAMTILKMTEDIEENGGMMIKNNSRRRTPGGVFFQLLRTDKNIEQSVMDKIFEGEMNSFETKRLYDERRKQKKKRKAAAKAALKAKKELLQPKLEQAIKMEEDSTLMEEEPPIVNDIIPNIKSEVNEPPIIKSELKESDPEDGEIDD